MYRMHAAAFVRDDLRLRAHYMGGSGDTGTEVPLGTRYAPEVSWSFHPYASGRSQPCDHPCRSC